MTVDQLVPAIIGTIAGLLFIALALKVADMRARRWKLEKAKQMDTLRDDFREALLDITERDARIKFLQIQNDSLTKEIIHIHEYYEGKQNDEGHSEHRGPTG